MTETAWYIKKKHSQRVTKGVQSLIQRKELNQYSIIDI